MMFRISANWETAPTGFCQRNRPSQAYDTRLFYIKIEGESLSNYFRNNLEL